MTRNRIVIDFDNQAGQGRQAGGRHRSSRSGIVRVLAIIAVLLVLLVVGITAGGYLWWQHYQTTPAYSLALLTDAAQRNDTEALDKLLNTDKIAADFVTQIRERVPATAAWASQIDLAKMSSSPTVKATLRDQLIKETRRLTEAAADKPFVIVALAVPRFADIKQENQTAQATVSLRDERIELTMAADGDRWQMIAVKDDKLAAMIAQAMIANMPSNGARVQDELQRQLSNLPNLGK